MPPLFAHLVPGVTWPLCDVGSDGTSLMIDAEAPDGSPFELPIRLTR